jgi:hypothetical protein
VEAAANLNVHLTIQKRNRRDDADHAQRQSPLEAEPTGVDYSRNDDKKPSLV